MLLEDTAIVTKPKAKSEYIPAIDGLRAMAVLFVLEEHFFPPTIAHKLQLGRIGVDIFFVISGFLITGILLRYKQNKSTGEGLKTFYARRVLRIFPIYYLYLFCVFFAGLITATAFKWSLAYLTNFYVISTNDFPRVIGHFWSLAVEEQFYFVWPFIIFLTPKPYIKEVIVAVLLASLVFTAFSDKMTAYVHPLACVNALALGALLATINMKYLKGWTYTISAAILVSICVVFYDLIPNVLRSANALLGGSLIINLTGTDDVVKRFFENRIMRWIGSISYGIYVYHFLFRWDVDLWLSEKVRNLNIPVFSAHAFLVVVPCLFGLTIFTAYLSHRFIETPILKLKKRFR